MLYVQNTAACTQVVFLIVFLCLHSLNEPSQCQKGLLAFCVSTHIGSRIALVMLAIDGICLFYHIHSVITTHNYIGMVRGLFSVAVKKDTTVGYLLPAALLVLFFIFLLPVMVEQAAKQQRDLTVVEDFHWIAKDVQSRTGQNTAADSIEE